MKIIAKILGFLSLLTVFFSYHLHATNFSPTVYPASKTLTCKKSFPTTDVRKVPVEKDGSIYSLRGKKNITAEVQKVADRIARLQRAGYERVGSIKTNSKGVRYVEVHKKVVATVKMALAIRLRIKANRTGAIVGISDLKVPEPSIDLQPPIRKIISKRTVAAVKDFSVNVFNHFVKDMQRIGNDMSAYRINYTAQEDIFDQALAGRITREIPITYCGKTRKIKVRIDWNNHFTSRPLGADPGDW